MNLVVDIGNTQAKAAFFENNTIVNSWVGLDREGIRALINQKRPTAMIVSSVAEPPTWLSDLMQQHPHYLLLDASTSLPFQNLYKTPRTLGADRIAGVAAAVHLFPGRQALVIDAGSCITYDVVDQSLQYFGGSISPGIRMRCRAMHTFTSRLPLVDVDDTQQNTPLPGSNTKEALQSGAWHGTLAEITQMIRMYEDKFGNLQVVICGGDAVPLSQALQVEHRLIPELILIGLNTILAYNVS